MDRWIEARLMELRRWRRYEWPHWRRMLRRPLGYAMGVREWLGSNTM